MAIFSVACLLFAFALWQVRPRGKSEPSRIQINGRDTTLTARRASGWMERQVGLLNHADLVPGIGLVLQPSRSIHTLGMAFPLDVVFFDAEGIALDVVCGVPPGERTVKGPKGTRGTLEFRAGTVEKWTEIAVGSRICLV